MEDLENIEEYSSEEEEEIMENNPLDKLIPNHKELSREEIGREIFKFVNKINNDANNDPEIIKQNAEREHNAFMKLLGIKNEAPSRPPITYRTLQQDIIDMCEKYDSESDESEEEDEDKRKIT
jgi:hypothetical protein